MKVVIAGGYGVFGSLTARLLVRDGHAVWIAGRDRAKAEALACSIGAAAICVDLRRRPKALFAPAPDVLIDATGPFQRCGPDRYDLPRLCISHRCHYLDLSDAAGFTSGIATLDEAAKAAGVFVLSGASSVPGLSSVIVNDLIAGLDDTDLIDIAILPGNRAPRGQSVIESIVGGVGRSTAARRGGVWRNVRGWTDRRTYTLAPGLRRTGYYVEVPDISLFPEFFAARSVMFRAGLELGIMNHALSLLAWLRRARNVTLTRPVLRVLYWISDLLYPFGTDRGGMQVTVTGRRDTEVIRRTWTLVAEKGDGPFVPGILCRSLLRHIATIPHGARPCLAEINREKVEEAMSDLAITTSVREGPAPSLFQSALGDRWHRLPPEVQAIHGVQDVGSFSGRAEVTRGRSLIARVAASMFGFPKAGTDVPVTVTKTRTDTGEIWHRNFDGRGFKSRCTPAPAPFRYYERFGPFNFEQDLPVADGRLHLPVRRGWFLGIPLPRILLPGSQSTEYAVDGRFHFDVALFAPLWGGLIVRYRGSLTPDREMDWQLDQSFVNAFSKPPH